MQTQTDRKVSSRQKEIVQQYLVVLDAHIDELRSGTAEGSITINDIAGQLYIHPRHLSNTIHHVLEQSPCDIYEDKLLEVAKELLLASNRSIASIARQLYYDPSNFTKFFKQYERLTPKQYREQHLS